MPNLQEKGSHKSKMHTAKHWAVSTKPKQAGAKQKKTFKKKKKQIKFVASQASSPESEVPEGEEFSLGEYPKVNGLCSPRVNE